MREPERREKLTLLVRDEAALRLDALAFAIWVANGGRSKSAAPQRQEALVKLLLGIAPAAEVRRYRCEGCEKVYGARWCWTHEDRFIVPETEYLLAESKRR